MVGVDLGGVLAGDDTVRRDYSVAWVGDNIFTARSTRWHYVTNPEDERPTWPPAAGEYPIESEELYFLPDDPDEQRNRIGENPEAVEALKRAIDTYKIRYVENATALPTSSPRSTSTSSSSSAT